MRKSSAWVARRGAAIAAVIGISVLGNLRLHASEVVKGNAAPAALNAQFHEREVFKAVGLAPRSETEQFPEEAAGADTDDIASIGHFVPAIYAWDPDVRFIFYRHISKWM